MANAKLGTKAVGSIVKLKVNGAAKEFIVVHQGKPSSLYDESCNGTWLLMKDIYEQHQWDSSNVNNLENSTIHSYLNSTFLNLFDSDIKDAIKQVKIPYRKNGGDGGTDQSGANGLSAKIFLLSGYEVGWTISGFPQDGAKLSYFESGTGTSANNKRIANLKSSPFSWWTRSPDTRFTSGVWHVDPNGSFVGDNNAIDSYGIRPALILPPDMEVDSSGNVTPPPPATHKTLVNGTVYDVTGGKCLVNGTAYSIKKGRTLIGGTGYDIKFSGPQTWILKEKPVKNAGMSELVAFESNSLKFKQIEARSENEYFNLIYYYAEKSENITAYSYDEVFESGEWRDQAYRTIIFDEEPTGDLLTWLQANATPQ